MEFYDVLQVARCDSRFFISVADYFKPEDEIAVSLTMDEWRRPGISLSKVVADNTIARHLRENKKMALIFSLKDGLWLQIPEWIFEANGRPEKFYVGISKTVQDEIRDLLLVPVPVPKEVITEQRVRIERKAPELQLINVHRGGELADFTETLERNQGIVNLSKDILSGAFDEGELRKPSFGEELSEVMCITAFGKDPKFDVSAGRPKVVR